MYADFVITLLPSMEMAGSESQTNDDGVPSHEEWEGYQGDDRRDTYCLYDVAEPVEVFLYV